MRNQFCLCSQMRVSKRTVWPEVGWEDRPDHHYFRANSLLLGKNFLKPLTKNDFGRLCPVKLPLRPLIAIASWPIAFRYGLVYTWR